MSDTPWTPGPWEQEGVIVRASGQFVLSRDEGEANARLVAAAPEMAEALEAIAQFAPDPGDHCGHCDQFDPDHRDDCCYVMADALLARIRGEATRASSSASHPHGS